MGGKDGSPGGGITLTPLRCSFMAATVAAFIGTLLGWGWYFDGSWPALLAFPLACTASGLVAVIGGLMLDASEQNSQPVNEIRKTMEKRDG